MAQLKDTTINDSGFLRLPRGTTAERPTLVGSSPGMVRFNTTTQTPEWYDDALSGWFPLGFIAPLATGGTITNIAQNGINYRVHTFLSSGTFTASRSGTVEFLIIGGGGAGGGNLSGGGGAGGVLMGSIAVQDGTAYPIIVGDGGARFSSSEVNSQSGGQSNKGRPSSAFNLVAAGGGAGGGGSSAAATAEMETIFFDVLEATEPSAGITTVSLIQNLNNEVGIGSTVFFTRQSFQIVSSHSFQYIGAGNDIESAYPSRGGATIQENEVITIDGGKINYTSTDQRGNFRIGDGVVIDQSTGTVSGDVYIKSLFTQVTPFILALGGD